MTLTQLVNEAERLQYGSGISDYTAMYNEMLRRLRNMSVKGKRWLNKWIIDYYSRIDRFICDCL